MPRLFSYKMTTDNGSAPNPYGPICTLAICKPFIRNVAQIGDWIAGIAGAKLGEKRNRLIYTMEVTEKLEWIDYDDRCRSRLSIKIPNNSSKEGKAGDCIYEYMAGEGKTRMRPGVHGEGDRIRDLSGRYVLLSNNFYYFGSLAEVLPDNLKEIAKIKQSHRSNLNEPFLKLFLDWLLGLGHHQGKIGEPNQCPTWEGGCGDGGHSHGPSHGGHCQ